MPDAGDGCGATGTSGGCGGGGGGGGCGGGAEEVVEVRRPTS
jgi:hypothetical protein